MPDLPDTSHLEPSGAEPLAPPAAPATGKTQHTPFRWPAPPFLAYPESLEQNQAQCCEFVGLNGHQVTGRLIFFVPDDFVAHVQVPPARTTMPLRFNQFRSLRILEALIPQPQSGDDAAARLGQQRPSNHYRIVLPDGELMEGETIGHVVSPHGLFLFPPVGEDGSVQRLFVPRGAYASFEIGSRIGELLVARQAATPQQVEQAAGMQQQLRNQKLGDILLMRQVVTPVQLQAAIDKQAAMPMLRLGEALTSLGLLTEEQLKDALSQQKHDRSLPLGELLVRAGVVTSEDLQSALARKMGYPLVKLDTFPFEEEALRKLPYAVVARVQVVPLMIRDGRLVIALDDPVRRQPVVDEIEFITGMKTVPVLAQCDDLDAILWAAYDRIGAAPARGQAASDAGAAPQPAPQAPGFEEERPPEHPERSIERLVHDIVIDAYLEGASDIHIESYPGREKIKIRFRQDGLLRPHLELQPQHREALLARIKIMSGLDVSERRKPQDGRMNFAKFSPGHPVELRVATIPTHGGLEDVVMHILASAKPVPLDKLGLSQRHLESLKVLIERPSGLLLCVGPSGCGKTTTLHSALSHINVPERKIWTAEDPVEISQPGLRQVQVNPQIGWTFAKALRAFLSADPDVILVGEMRDEETARLGVEAALTGHLVLSTLHTHSAPEAVTRLIDMGLDPFNFADSLLGVLAQRLVRRLCPHCRGARPASEEEVEELLDDYLYRCPPEHPLFRRDNVREDWLARFGQGGRLMHFHSPGCERCGHTGQQGHAGLHELMPVSRETRRLIQTRASAEQLLGAAMCEGMRSLRQDGIEKVLQGVTSMSEVRATSSA